MTSIKLQNCVITLSSMYQLTIVAVLHKNLGPVMSLSDLVHLYSAMWVRI